MLFTHYFTGGKTNKIPLESLIFISDNPNCFKSLRREVVLLPKVNIFEFVKSSSLLCMVSVFIDCEISVEKRHTMNLWTPSRRQMFDISCLNLVFLFIFQRSERFI